MGGQTHEPPPDRRRRAEREREIATLASRQHGVVARAQLIGAGLGRSAIDSRIRSGRLIASRNVTVDGLEVDALWPRERLIVELDGFAFHRHRAAFERDRARDAALQADGYRVIRLTWRRLEEDPAAVAAELSGLLRNRA